MKENMKIWCTDIDEKRMVINAFGNNYHIDSAFRNRLYSVPMGFIIEDGKLRQTKSNVIFNRCKYKETSAKEYLFNGVVKIGETVKVTNNGATYSAYRDWHGLGDYKDNWILYDAPQNGKEYKVVNIDTHTVYNSYLIVLIQDVETEQVFIIGTNGIKKVD